MNANLSEIHLALFLSRATPLARWEKMGILDRELAIYKAITSELGGLSIVTSGGQEELKYQDELNSCILYNRWGLSPNLYSIFAPFLHSSGLKQATVYKTNQMDGAWTAVIAGAVHHKPVIVRAGYLWAEFHRQEGGKGLKASWIDYLQAFSFRNADLLVMTTERMKGLLVNKYQTPPEKIKVVPNYVDTDLHKPMPGIQPVRGKICTVGRLHPRKNLNLLIESLGGTSDTSLAMIGTGEQQQALERLAKDKNVEVNFMGAIPHNQVPKEINRCEIFILPSSFEGHPKALIEAMACGVAVIGTDVPGIRELIQHGETGWICQVDADSIREAICKILNNPQLRTRLGEKARKYVLENYNLERVAQMELDAIREVTRPKRGKAR